MFNSCMKGGACGGTSTGDRLYDYLDQNGSIRNDQLAWNDFLPFVNQAGWDQSSAQQSWWEADTDRTGFLSRKEFLKFANFDGVKPYMTQIEQNLPQNLKDRDDIDKDQRDQNVDLNRDRDLRTGTTGLAGTTGDFRGQQQQLPGQQFQQGQFYQGQQLPRGQQFQQQGQYLPGQQQQFQDQQRMNLAREHLDINKTTQKAGDVDLGKHIETQHVQKTVPVMHEELFIERRPVGGQERSGRIESDGGNIRIPLMREQLHTEKRAVVDEEVVVGKRPVQEQQTVSADLAREHLDINKSAGLDQRNQTGPIFGDSRTTGSMAGQGNYNQGLYNQGTFNQQSSSAGPIVGDSRTTTGPLPGQGNYTQQTGAMGTNNPHQSGLMQSASGIPQNTQSGLGVGGDQRGFVGQNGPYY